MCSRYIDELTSHSPVLEQLHTLNNILNMEFIEVREYSIKDVLKSENEGKHFRMLNNTDIIRVELTRENIPVAYITGENTKHVNLIEDVYTLDGIINARFVEVS